jgi:hypothetical protein
VKPERAVEPLTMGETPRPVEDAPASPEAPALSRDHLKRELEALHQDPHRTLRSAIFARLAEAADDGATVDARVRGELRTFRVVATSGELALRRELTREGEEATVYVVPFARSLPRDLEAVLAGGRLWLPQVEWLLPRRFGARAGTRRLLASKLRLVAQRDGTRSYGRGEAPSIDLDDAWLVFLRDRLGVEALETEAQLFAATLLDRERRGKALGALVAPIKGAAEELVQVLDRRLGPSAPHVLAAWLGDAVVELSALALAGEATREVLREGKGHGFALLTTVLEMRVLQTPDHPLRPLRNSGGVAGLARALLDLGYLVPLVWTALAGDAVEPLRRAILGEAETLLGAAQVRPLALGSNRLPFVFEHRCQAFVAAIEAVVEAVDVAAVRRAIQVVDEATGPLLAHEGARGDGRLAEQVEMAARLAAFLGEPDARPAPASLGEAPHAEVIRLATFQAAVGGHLDWARQSVRVDGSGPLGKGLLALVGRVDQVRDALDARFARAYAQLVGGRGDRGVLRGTALVDGHRAELVLIEDALARLGLELLEQGPELRLLVLVMDGMSTANLAELWASIARTSFVPVSRGRRDPVLAHVPTITRLSRSALFAGRALGKGDSLDTGRDGDRLAQHPVVKRLGEVPKVLLRKEILGAGGGLSDDADRVVKGDARLVAVVVNAIDDQLKGSAQLRVTLSTRHIPALDALLDAAFRTGRVVLLLSDHGNISSQRFIGAAVRSTGKEVEGAERGARHRGLAAAEAALPDEIELPAGALAMPKGTDRVAVAVHETLRYTTPLHAGEHGGASLAEAIAPAVLLAPPGLLSELKALGVEAIPLEPPSFWNREQALAVEPEAPPPPAPTERVQVASPSPRVAQTVLSFEPSSEPGLAETVFKSALFRSQLREIAESERPLAMKAIEILLRHGGRMARDPFAVGLGIDTAGKGLRVPGFLDRLERVLNVDQEPVISMDRKGQSVALDLRRLRSLFLEDEGG